MPQLEPATLAYTVTDDDTAAAVGSGSLPVLGTPRLLTWLEAATCASLEPTLPEGSTSVGTRVQVEHLAASPVGAQVGVSASSAYVDGRLHRWAETLRRVAAHSESLKSGVRPTSMPPLGKGLPGD